MFPAAPGNADRGISPVSHTGRVGSESHLAGEWSSLHPRHGLALCRRGGPSLKPDVLVAQSALKSLLHAPGMGGSQLDISFIWDADSHATPGGGHLPSPQASGPLSHPAVQPFRELVNKAKALWTGQGMLGRAGEGRSSREPQREARPVSPHRNLDSRVTPWPTFKSNLLFPLKL